MITQELQKIFARDLGKLKEEIFLYRREEDIWKIEGDITNPAGNLCLHLVGNLKYFIGGVIGKVDYVRNRDSEFSAKNIRRHELIKMVEETMDVVSYALSETTDEQLNEVYPLMVFKEKMSTGYFLMHLATHLDYHLGQINYHRRLIAKKPENSPKHFDTSIIRSWQK